jgi:hypothetical protein
MDNKEIGNITDRQIIPICDGCPGSITICCRLYVIGKHDGTHYLDILKKKNIRGYDIWNVYKDKCDSDIYKMAEYLRKD